MLKADSLELKQACFAAELNSLYKQLNKQNIHKSPKLTSS